MARAIRTFIGVALITTGLIIAADAHAVTIVRNDGDAAQYQIWADNAKVPTPQTTVEVSEEECPGEPGLAGCVFWGDPHIYMVPSGNPTTESYHAVFLHELGHVFDDQELTTEQRVAFRDLIGSDEYWSADSDFPPEELFAETYMYCARFTRWPPAGWLSGYGHRPSKRQFRERCAFIRSIQVG